MLKECFNCHKNFEVPKWKFKNYIGRPANKHFFCSNKCRKESWAKVLPSGENHYHWKGGDVNKICEFCKKPFTKQRKGKDREYRFCSLKCVHKWMKGRFIREKNPHWKGSPINKSRTETNYLEWRRKVGKIDNWSCRRCDDNSKIRIHHIQNYKEFPKLRYDVFNGITFCDKCHTLFHKIYGKKGNTKKQVKEFINDPQETLSERIRA